MEVTSVLIGGTELAGNVELDGGAEGRWVACGSGH
jgi:hypothetical protein